MKTRVMVSASLLGALSFIVRQFSFPFFVAPFLKVEFSEVPVLLAGVFLGPGVGLCVQAIKDVLLVVLRGSSLWGVFSDFVCGGMLIASFSIVWRGGGENRSLRLLAATVISIVLRCVISIPLNYLVLSVEFGHSISHITAMLAPAIVPFNAFKSLCNIGLFVPVYHFIRQNRLLGASPAPIGKGR